MSAIEEMLSGLPKTTAKSLLLLASPRNMETLQAIVDADEALLAQLRPYKQRIKELENLIDDQDEQVSRLTIAIEALKLLNGTTTTAPPSPDPTLQDSSAGLGQNAFMATPAYQKFAKWYVGEGLDVAAALYREEARNFDMPVYKAGTQASKDEPYTFIMSTPSVDRMGDIIESGSWDLREFRKNPIALFSHSHHMPIGKWKNVKITDGKLQGELVMAKEGTSRIVDEVRSLLEQGILRTVSVGFRVIKYEPIKDEDDKNTGGYRFTKVQLLETSIVAVPAQAEAVMT